MPFWIPAAIIGGSLIGADAAGSAADAQSDAARYSADLQQKQYEQNREDLSPWRDAGKTALGQLTSGTAPGGQFDKAFTAADFTQDPGYDFRFGEGQRAVEAGASARGGALGGRALKELARYGQGFASNEYNNAYNRYNNDLTTRFNRLSSLAGNGQTASRDVAQMGAQSAAGQGAAAMAGGDARASGFVGTANAITGGAQSLGNFYQQQQMMDRFFPNSGSGGSTYASTPQDLSNSQMYGYGG